MYAHQDRLIDRPDLFVGPIVHDTLPPSPDLPLSILLTCDLYVCICEFTHHHKILCVLVLRQRATRRQYNTANTRADKIGTRTAVSRMPAEIRVFFFFLHTFIQPTVYMDLLLSPLPLIVIIRIDEGPLFSSLLLRKSDSWYESWQESLPTGQLSSMFPGVSPHETRGNPFFVRLKAHGTVRATKISRIRHQQNWYYLKSTFFCYICDTYINI